MKKIIIPIMILVTMFLGSCSKVIIYEPSDAEIDLYSKVYMPRANDEIVIRPINTTGMEQKVTYSAYLGGPIDAPNDINITFAVDAAKVAEYNSLNDTDYKLLPESSYTLESLQAVINKGNRSTKDFKFIVTPGDYLDMFDTYVLPLTISEIKGTSLNEELSTVYYVFMVTYPAGQVPRDQVLSLGPNYGSLMGIFSAGGLLTTKKDPASGKTYRWEYKVDGEGKFTSPPVRLGDVDWAEARALYYHNDDSVFIQNAIDVNGWSSLFRLKVDRSNPDILIDYAAFPQHHMGIEWGPSGPNIVHIIPFSKYTLTIDGAGVLRRQDMFTRSPGWTWDGNNMPVGIRVEVGTGLTGLRNVLPYKDKALLAVDGGGKLWYYPMSADAKPGVRRNVGSGWDMYDRILVSGDDILAIDSNNDVYRYEFNPIGFYPLK